MSCVSRTSSEECRSSRPVACVSSAVIQLHDGSSENLAAHACFSLLGAPRHALRGLSSLAFSILFNWYSVF